MPLLIALTLIWGITSYAGPAEEEVVHQFYSSFQQKDFNGMERTLDQDVTFSDPAFPSLTGKQVFAMWEMFTETESLSIEFEVLGSDGNIVFGRWTAEYEVLGNPVVNPIESRFIVEDGRIVEHVDEFDIYAWGKQALGRKYYLVYPMLKTVVRHMAKKRLNKFMDENGY